jgi:hypothetical protein
MHIAACLTPPAVGLLSPLLARRCGNGGVVGFLGLQSMQLITKTTATGYVLGIAQDLLTGVVYAASATGASTGNEEVREEVRGVRAREAPHRCATSHTRSLVDPPLPFHLQAYLK